VNAKYIIPILFVFACIFVLGNEEHRSEFFSYPTALHFYSQVPMLTFFIGFAVLSVLAFRFNFSLIPSLGLLCCFYMLSQLGYKNWLYFTAWLVLGLIIYFVYGYRHSNLAARK